MACSCSGQGNKTTLNTHGQTIMPMARNIFKTKSSETYLMVHVYSSCRSLTQKNVIKYMKVWCASTATFTKKRWVWSENIKMHSVTFVKAVDCLIKRVQTRLASILFTLLVFGCSFPECSLMSYCIWFSSCSCTKKQPRKCIFSCIKQLCFAV